MSRRVCVIKHATIQQSAIMERKVIQRPILLSCRILVAVTVRTSTCYRYAGRSFQFQQHLLYSYNFQKFKAFSLDFPIRTRFPRFQVVSIPLHHSSSQFHSISRDSTGFASAVMASKEDHTHSSSRRHRDKYDDCEHLCAQRRWELTGTSTSPRP